MVTASPLPFVRYHRSVYVVPFVPTRLSFAVLVQDALRRLDAKRKLGPKDVVAVQLPPRVEPAYEEAVAHLPTVTQVVLRDRDGRLVDAWPVTPCDARVEAVRSARERNVAVAYVDSESGSTPRWRSTLAMLSLGAITQSHKLAYSVASWMTYRCMAGESPGT